jgi:hypothetical protein
MCSQRRLRRQCHVDTRGTHNCLDEDARWADRELNVGSDDARKRRGEALAKCAAVECVDGAGDDSDESHDWLDIRRKWQGRRR